MLVAVLFSLFDALVDAVPVDFALDIHITDLFTDQIPVNLFVLFSDGVPGLKIVPVDLFVNDIGKFITALEEFGAVGDTLSNLWLNISFEVVGEVFELLDSLF